MPFPFSRPVKFFLLFLFLASCRSSLQSDLGRIRAEIQELERSVPPDAPLWITRDYVGKNPALSEEDIFDTALQDHTASVPDFVYYHVLGKLAAMSEEEIERQCRGEFPFDACRMEPAAFRGGIWRVTGTAVALRTETIQNPDTPLREVYAGICTVASDQPILFHLVEKPDVLYLNQDTVEFYGVFVKLISKSAGDHVISAPLFFAKKARKYL